MLWSGIYCRLSGRTIWSGKVIVRVRHIFLVLCTSFYTHGPTAMTSPRSDLNTLSPRNSTHSTHTHTHSPAITQSNKSTHIDPSWFTNQFTMHNNSHPQHTRTHTSRLMHSSPGAGSHCIIFLCTRRLCILYSKMTYCLVQHKFQIELWHLHS